MLGRLCGLIPLTPWPVILYIRLSKIPTCYIIFGPSFTIANFLLTSLGLFLLCESSHKPKKMAGLGVLLLLHFFILQITILVLSESHCGFV